MPHIEPSTLLELKDLLAWEEANPDSAPVSLLDYISLAGKLDYLFAYAELFMPTLVTHNGRRFIASKFSVEVYDDWVKTGASLRDIQCVMNHIHISSLAQDSTLSDQAAVEAASVIATIWKRTLGADGLTVVTEGSDAMDASVTFHD